MNQAKPLYVISYDVVSDRRRNRIAHALEGYGERVQDSVFEVRLSPSQKTKLAKRLEKEIDPKEDGVRWYFLCEECAKKTERSGVGPERFVIEKVKII